MVYDITVGGTSIKVRAGKVVTGWVGSQGGTAFLTPMGSVFDILDTSA